MIWCWWIDMFKKISEANQSRKKSRIIHRNLKAVAQHKDTDLAFIHVLSLRPLASFLNKHHCDLKMFTGMTEPNMKTTQEGNRTNNLAARWQLVLHCPSTAPTETRPGKKRITGWKNQEIQKDNEEKEEEWPKYKACVISLESSKCHGALKTSSTSSQTHICTHRHPINQICGLALSF